MIKISVQYLKIAMPYLKISVRYLKISVHSLKIAGLKIIARVCACVCGCVGACAPHLANISKIVQDATRATPTGATTSEQRNTATTTRAPEPEQITIEKS